MRAKGLLLSAILICWSLGWSGIAECYDVYADSSGNVLNLRVNNTNPGFAMSGVVVKMIEKPSWVSNFSPGSQSLGNIAASGQGTASFTFNVNANTSVGNSGNIRFQVITTSGDSWNKDVSVKVVSSNGVITGDVTGATNVTITVTGTVTKSVLTESSGYRIENLLPGNYTITATKNEYKSHPAQEIRYVPTGGMINGVNFTMIKKPDMPNLSSPENGITINTLQPELDWEDVPGAVDLYTVEISTDSTFSWWKTTSAIRYGSSYSIWSNLDNNTVYYWRVKAKNYAGESNWSMTRCFIININPVGSISGQIINFDQYIVTITAIKTVSIVPPFEKSVNTNQFGEYTIGGLSPGIYTVTAFKMGYDLAIEPTVYVYAGEETWGIDFTLTLLSARASIRLSAPSSATIRNAPQYSRFAQAMQAKRLRSPAIGTPAQVLEPIEEVMPVLRTGLVDVIIETIMPLTDAPVLSYMPVAGGSLEKVVLSGDGSVWRGQIFVESTTSEGTATFEYYGVNEQGSPSTQIDAGRNFEVDTTVLPDENTNVSNRDGTSVDVTKGVVDTPINIQIIDPDQTQRTGGRLAPALASALSRRMAALEGTPLIEIPGATRHIEATIDGKGCRVSQANANFSFNIPYQDMDQDGLIDNTEIVESSLKAYYVNERGEWQQSVVSTVNAEQNRVMVSHNLFTTYFLAGVTAITTIDNICKPIK